MSDQKNDASPVRLRGDNFTPQARTPWGGRRIRALKQLGEGPVGESWELSVEPSFPSRCEPDDELLGDRIARAPEDWLGEEAPRGGTALLVKLVDAADELSVQIHPSDDYGGLGPGESGKPESWYVADRDPGAGIYLGLAPGVDARSMARALDDRDDVSRLLRFVPVEPGDFFVIEAGTPHCIGRGVMLVEPQHVEPGKRGVTYRYWDWDRRYDAQGNPDPDGRPRALHRDHALAVTDWDRGTALPRLRCGPAPVGEAASIEVLAGPEGGLWSAHVRVARLAGTGTLPHPEWNVLAALTVLEGRAKIGGLWADQGRTIAIPASYRGTIELERASAILSGAVVTRP